MTSARPEPLSNCVWPVLPARYDRALRQAVAFIVERYDPTGLIACGSIIRGNPNPGSDFDLYVVIAQPFRQRVQRRFSGIPAEIFVNPPAQIRRYFAEEMAEGRPCTAHMLSAGFVVLDRDPVIQALMAEAQMSLDGPFQLSDSRRSWLRYSAIDLLDNAVDLRDMDADNAEMILHQAVQSMVDYAFLSQDRYLPRPKERLQALESFRPDVGFLVRALYDQSDLDSRFEIAAQLAEHLLGTTTFFEWETDPEQLSVSP